MHIIETGDTTVGDFIKHINECNVEDAEWSFDYASPSYIFNTNDTTLIEQARDFAIANDMLPACEAQ